MAKGYAWYAFQFARELDEDQQRRYREAEQRARSQRQGFGRNPNRCRRGSAGNTSGREKVPCAGSDELGALVGILVNSHYQLSAPLLLTSPPHQHSKLITYWKMTMTDIRFTAIYLVRFP